MWFEAAMISARRAAGLTQAELAARSATSQPTLCAYERGAKVPSAATLERILAAAGRTLATRPSHPVTTPRAGELAQVGERLAEVLDLAAALPVRHEPSVRYPRLPARPASRS